MSQISEWEINNIFQNQNSVSHPYLCDVEVIKLGEQVFSAKADFRKTQANIKQIT